MQESINKNVALKLIEIFSEYEDDFDLSTVEGRQSLEKHLVNKLKTGNISIKDGIVLGFFNEGFTEESPEIKFKDTKSFVENKTERERIKSKIEYYLKIGESVDPTTGETTRQKRSVSASTLIANYTNLKSKLELMGETVDSPLSFIGRGDFTKNFPQKGKWRSSAINAISSIARGISSNLETMFIDPSDKDKFLNDFSWVGEVRSARWNERIKLAGKSSQDWTAANVKSPAISQAVHPSLHFQTLQKGLAVVENPEVKNFLYLKFFLPPRAVQFKNLVYGKGSGIAPYYDPDTKMIVFESDPDVIDESTGIRGSKTLGQKHYFNFIVSDNIHNSITRMHEKNVENGLVGGNKPPALFPTLYNTEDNTKIINEIRRPGGLFDLTNTPAYRKMWQRGGINDVADLRKWAYSFYETHYSTNKGFAKGLDQSMGHKITSKQIGARYGGKNAIKDTWDMTEFRELLTTFEQEMLNSFKDIHADELPPNFKITTGDLPSVFLVNLDLEGSPAPVIYNPQTLQLDVTDFKSSNIGIETSGAGIAQLFNQGDLVDAMEKDLQATSLQTRSYLNKLRIVSEQTGYSINDLYEETLDRLSIDKLAQDQIIPAFEEQLKILQAGSVKSDLKGSNITQQASDLQAKSTTAPTTPSAPSAPSAPATPDILKSTSPAETDPVIVEELRRKRANWAHNLSKAVRKPSGVKKAVLFAASALTPQALLGDYAAEAAIIEAYKAGEDVLDPELSELEEDLGGLERIDPTQYDSPYFERAEEEAFLGVDDDPDFRFGVPSEGRFDELDELKRMGLPLQKYHFTDEPRPLEQYRGHIGDIPRIVDETYDTEREKLAEQITGIENFGPKLENIRGDEDRFLAEAQDASEQGRLSDIQKEYLNQVQDKYGRGTERALKLQREGDQFAELGDFKTLDEEQRDKAERAVSTNQQFKQLFDLPT